MKVQKLGHFVDGREVHLFTMENKNGVKASFTDLGGVWLSSFSRIVAERNWISCFLWKTGKISWKIPDTWEKWLDETAIVSPGEGSA